MLFLSQIKIHFRFIFISWFSDSSFFSSWTIFWRLDPLALIFIVSPEIQSFASFLFLLPPSIADWHIKNNYLKNTIKILVNLSESAIDCVSQGSKQMISLETFWLMAFNSLLEITKLLHSTKHFCHFLNFSLRKICY